MNRVTIFSNFFGIKKFKDAITNDFNKIANYMPANISFECFDDLDYFVMALEDRRFLKHKGVDILSIIREMLKFFLKRRHGGASTIDMQMVRTITGFRDLTLNRKIYEIILSVMINRVFTKHQIIRCYLNNAFFGTGIYGCNAACYAIYKKELHLIGFEEKAFLAAMLLRPKPLKESKKWLDLVSSRSLYAQKIYRTMLR